jgi:hypothetical protein
LSNTMTTAVICHRPRLERDIRLLAAVALHERTTPTLARKSVSAGEEGKWHDFSRSAPPFVVYEISRLDWLQDRTSLWVRSGSNPAVAGKFVMSAAVLLVLLSREQSRLEGINWRPK